MARKSLNSLLTEPMLPQHDFLGLVLNRLLCVRLNLPLKRASFCEKQRTLDFCRETFFAEIPREGSEEPPEKFHCRDEMWMDNTVPTR